MTFPLESVMYQTELIALIGALRKVCDRFESIITSSTLSDQDISYLRDDMTALMTKFVIELENVLYEGEAKTPDQSV